MSPYVEQIKYEGTYLRCYHLVVVYPVNDIRGGLRLLGAPGWNLERGPISNEEEGGKRIFWDYLRIIFIPMWDIRPHILGLGPINGGGPWL